MIERKHGFGKKAVLMAAAAVMVVGMLAGCGKSAGSGQDNASAETGGEGLKKITLLLDWTPNTNHTGIYTARDLGYYEEAGLEVDIQLPYDGTATQLVGAGKGDFGISNTDDTLYADTLEDPMPVTSIAAVIQHNSSGFVSLKEAGIESPADWGGKTYGGFGLSTEEKIVKTIAAEHGVDPETIHFVDLGNTDTLTSLQNEIDFIWVFEATELISLDKQEVEYNYIPVRECGEAYDYYTPVVIVNTDAAAKDPEMVRDFLEATSRGYEYASDNPEEAAELLLKAEPDLDEYIIKNGQVYLAERYAQDAPRWGWQEEEVWKRYADFLFDNGLIEREADMTKVFTTEYLPEG